MAYNIEAEVECRIGMERVSANASAAQSTGAVECVNSR